MKRVLIVDDKEENLYYLHVLLTGHGFVVDSARHGAEALVKARQQPPDLIVSDLLMPVMDGYTLLRHWKTDDRLRQIPFIVYTATYTEPEDERLALNLGADAFILKPAEPEDFLARIREVEGKAAAPVPMTPRSPLGDESEMLKVYSQTLIRKLEEKTLQLEESNKALQADIAERKAAQEKLAQQAALLDKAQDAILVRDLDHTITYWNKSAERLYGWSAKEAIGRSARELLRHETAGFDEATCKVLEHGDWVGELTDVTKQGRSMIIEGHWTLLRDDKGQPKAVLAINSDISEKKRLESQFMRAQRMESIGTLASGIAHDLNNVLAPILISLEMLKDTVKNEDTATLLTTLESATRRGIDLVQQVLAFTRGIEGKRIPVNPAHILREIQKIIRETFPKNIEFALRDARGLWTVTGDPTQLHQVFMNLCVNARDAMPNGGNLTITLENATIGETDAALNAGAKPGDYVAAEVTDTGTGIPLEIQERIFEPFFTTKEIGKGTGLGLSTTMGIINSHGGFIKLMSAVGKGTRFKVYLPADANKRATETDWGEQAQVLRGKGELILVVDDDEGVRGAIRRILEHYGYHVLLAVNGAEAVSLYTQRQNDIAAVITDMSMPVMDGTAAINALRTVNPRVRVIGSSGLTTSESANGITGGLKHFIPKPYTADAILKMLREVLQEK